MHEVEHTIKDGDQGIRQTVRHMARLISRDATDPKIIRKAKSLKGDSDMATARNIFEYVYKNYKYKSDPDDKEVVSAPIQLYKCAERGETCDLPSWAGQDCDDLTVILCSLYKAAGLRTYIKIIDWKPGQSGFSHVYSLVELPSKKIVIPTDAVAKAKGFAWEKTPVKRYEVYDTSGSLVTKGTGAIEQSSSGESTDKLMDSNDGSLRNDRSLRDTQPHTEVANIKQWWQHIEEHAGLITATTAVVSICWAVYISTHKKSH